MSTETAICDRLERQAEAMERIADAVEILASGTVHEQMRKFVEAHENKPDAEATASFARHLELHFCPRCKNAEAHE